MSGWIKLHRKLMSKAYYSKDSEKVHLWIHILMCANHTGREEMLGGKPIHCNSGQFTVGRKQLSSETGISESKIQRILTYFEKTEQQIEQQTTNTNRLITVINWHEHQDNEQQIEQQLNNNRTTSEQQVNNKRTHLKKEKNEKKDNNYLEDIYFPINPDIDNAFKDYLKIRIENKYTMTDRVINTLVKKLREIAGDDANKALEVIENAILGKWKSFYSDNKTYKSNGTNQQDTNQPRREFKIIRAK